MKENSDLLESGLHNYDFISCMRFIDSRHTDRPRHGRALRPSDEVIRLSQKPMLRFIGPALDSLEEREGLHKYQLFCNFTGLFGTNGALPLHLTEYADQRARHHQDSSFSAFIDLFNHRMLSLFYRACVEFDPAVNLDRDDSNFSEEVLAALGGYTPDAAHQRDVIPDYTKRFNACWMGRQSKSPDGIKALLSQYFEVEVDVIEFTGGWLDLPAEAQTRLDGRESPQLLGESTYLGRRTWVIGHKFSVVVGPLDWDEFISFKPGGHRARALFHLMKNYVGDEWDWDLKLSVTSAKAIRLDRKSALGFNCVLGRIEKARETVREVSFNQRTLNKPSIGMAA